MIFPVYPIGELLVSYGAGHPFDPVWFTFYVMPEVSFVFTI